LHNHDKPVFSVHAKKQLGLDIPSCTGSKDKPFWHACFEYLKQPFEPNQDDPFNTSQWGLVPL
jgi:hypothetical protein